nr:hypothetical protein [uncultured Dyadobacter sp.]
MKNTLCCLAFLLAFVGKVFSQIPINMDYYNGVGFKPSPYGGFQIYPRWGNPGQGHGAVFYQDFQEWWKKYPKTLKKEYRKKFYLVEQGSYVKTPNVGESKAGIYIGGRPLNPTSADDYKNFWTRFTANDISPKAIVAMLHVAYEEDLESVYYKMALDSKLSEDLTFDTMIEYCNNYLTKYPNGTLENRRAVKRRLVDITEIPLEVRQLQVKEIAAEAKKRREAMFDADKKSSELFWAGVTDLFFSDNGGSSETGNGEARKCQGCFGKGRMYQYSCSGCDGGGYVTCPNCGGSGTQ